MQRDIPHERREFSFNGHKILVFEWNERHDTHGWAWIEVGEVFALDCALSAPNLPQRVMPLHLQSFTSALVRALSVESMSSCARGGCPAYPGETTQ